MVINALFTAGISIVEQRGLARSAPAHAAMAA